MGSKLEVKNCLVDLIPEMSSPFELSQSDLEVIAERFRMLGEPMRLRIIAALKDGECTVTDLVSKTGGNQANISRHLNALKSSGIVDRRKEGTWCYYMIADPTVYDLCQVVCKNISNLNGAADVFNAEQGK